MTPLAPERTERARHEPLRVPQKGAEPEAKGALDGGGLEGAGPPDLFQPDGMALADRYLGPRRGGFLGRCDVERGLRVQATMPDQVSQRRAHLLEGAAALLFTDAVHDQSDVARHLPPPCETSLRLGIAGSVHRAQR
jgi:hypothetical protein